MPNQIDPELKARAVRLVTEHEQEYASPTAAALVVAKQLDLRRGIGSPVVVQAQVDTGSREWMPTTKREEIRR